MFFLKSSKTVNLIRNDHFSTINFKGLRILDERLLYTDIHQIQNVEYYD